MYFGPTGQVNGSLTGQYLRGARRIPVPERRRTPNERWLTIRGAAENNLKTIDVTIPLLTNNKAISAGSEIVLYQPRPEKQPAEALFPIAKKQKQSK